MIPFTIGLVVGSFIGVGVMCLFVGASREMPKPEGNDED